MKPLKEYTVFDLEHGDKIYNSATNTIGIITNITETSYEYIEAFVKWSNENTETKLNLYDKNYYLLTRGNI